MSAQIGTLATLWWWPAGSAALRHWCGFVPSVLGDVFGVLGTAHLGTLTQRGPGDLLAGVVVPVLGYTLLSCGPVQLLFSAVFAAALGRRLESRSGFWRLLLLYAAGGLVGALAEGLRWPDAVTLRTGTSVATSCLVGAYAITHGRARMRMLVPVLVVPMVVELPAAVVVGAWIVLQLEPVQRLADFDAVMPASWAGLAGGFVTGTVLGPLLVRRRKPAA